MDTVQLRTRDERKRKKAEEALRTAFPGVQIREWRYSSPFHRTTATHDFLTKVGARDALKEVGGVEVR